MLAPVDEWERQEGEIAGGGAEPRRVYPPAEVQGRLGVSASGLRRLAGIYERAVGPLSRDERGRVWPAEAIGALEAARAAVREQRAVSIEAALRARDVPHDVAAGPGEGGVSARTAEGSHADVGPAAAILEELRALRELVEEQSRRIGELEDAVRTGRELPAAEGRSEGGVEPPEMAPGRLYASPEGSDLATPPAGPETADAPVPASGPTEAQDGSEGPSEGSAGDGLEGREAPATREERGAWRRVRDWFGFR
jgi:hypothetical protein